MRFRHVHSENCISEVWTGKVLKCKQIINFDDDGTTACECSATVEN